METEPHEERLDAGTHDEASVEVTEEGTHDGAHHDGAERVERAELIIEAFEEHVQYCAEYALEKHASTSNHLGAR